MLVATAFFPLLLRSKPDQVERFHPPLVGCLDLGGNTKRNDGAVLANCYDGINQSNCSASVLQTTPSTSMTGKQAGPTCSLLFFASLRLAIDLSLHVTRASASSRC